MEFDYVIVGAGAAGCVLAYRLSEDPSVQVALIEAGAKDSHPFIRMPKGLAKVMSDPAHLWVYPAAPASYNANQREVWVRGRVLGGSSSINGMMYVRGQPADFDSIAELSSDDWSWEAISEAYRAIEGHEMGPAPTRGGSGPLRISLPTMRDKLTDAMVDSGKAMGWALKSDVNTPDESDSIGYAPRTIWKGARQSAATAFLKPIERRRNLTVLTQATADSILFQDRRARAVQIIQNGRHKEISARRDIIICCGAMATPGLLERSGVGAPELLEKLGIKAALALPAVGENLIEHRGLIMQWKLNCQLSQNREFQGWRLLRSTLRYYLTKDGPMSSAAYEIGGWFRTHPDLNRPDAQMLIAPYSFDFANNRQTLERFPGINLVTYPLRPTSKGNVHIDSVDPNAPPILVPNYHETEEDRRIMIGAVRTLREYAKKSPLAELIDVETLPGPSFQTDAEIIDAYDRFGSCGYHAVGSCRMGKDEGSVVDPTLRVRGLDALRIIDTSIMPIIPSGNTNGPTMAMAWRAAEVIRRS